MNRMLLLCVLSLIFAGCASTGLPAEMTESPTESASPTQSASIVEDTDPTLHPSDTPTQTPTRRPTLTSTATPTPLTLPTPFAVIPSDWLIYRNDAYGFMFYYPPAWLLEETEPLDHPDPTVGNFIHLSRDTASLVIGYKRAVDTEARIGCTGTAAGDFIEGGELTFLGESLPIVRIVYEDKLKRVFFDAPCREFARGELMFFIGLTDTNPKYEDIDMQQDTIDEAAQILATFQFIP